MILSDAQARVREGMQYLQSSVTANNLILEKMKETQEDLETGKSLPKFLIQEDATFTGLADVATANLPTGFIRLVEDGVPTWTSVDGRTSRELKIGDYSDLRRFWFGTTEDQPFALAIRKATIVLFPTPGAAWTVTYSYYKKATILVNASDENVWLLNQPYLIINGAGMRFAADRQDKDNMTKFSALYRANYASYLAKIVDEEIQDQNVIMGGNR